MTLSRSRRQLIWATLVCFLLIAMPSQGLVEENLNWAAPGNFGLPGTIDLPTAKQFPDGELVMTQQLHESLARSGISFQALPNAAFAFRYTGHGTNGDEAYGRVNHDRSFDAHISLLDEGRYFPAISIGLRDFIGTGWYSSEYIVGTKSIGNFELTAGLGFGRLAGRNSFSNPFGNLSTKFDNRESNRQAGDRGGTLGNINWFKGATAGFYSIRYQIGKKITLLAEYSPDLMWRERKYLEVKKPWNFGLSYQFGEGSMLK